MATSSSVLQEILDGPSLMPPPGVQPNFVNPSNINTACFVILTIALFGTTFAICVRMYTNWFILRSFNWEDCKRNLYNMLWFNRQLTYYRLAAYRHRKHLRTIGPSTKNLTKSRSFTMHILLLLSKPSWYMLV